MCAPAYWPFAREREFERAELLRIDGSNPDDEPALVEPLMVRRLGEQAV